MSYVAPDVRNYTIGRGNIYFARTNADDENTGEMHLGNGPAFLVTPTTENLDHYSSMEGIKKKDLSINVTTDIGLKFTLDEPNRNNINLALLGGDTIATTAQGDGNINNAVVIARLDKYVKEGMTYRDLFAGSIVVTDATGVVTYVEGTDYTVDYDIGRIRALSTGDITEGESLRVDYSYQASSYPTIQASTRIVMEGLVRFRGNGEQGTNFEIVAHKVKLAVTGDIPFISDDWAQIEWEAEVLDDTVNHPNSPYMDVLDISGGTVIES